MTSQFLGYWSMPLLELNKQPQGEKWVTLVERPDKADKKAQGELLFRWNFTRTVPLVRAVAIVGSAR